MARPLARDLLVKRPDPSNAGQFLNACGIVTKNLNINNNPITEEVLADCQDPSAGAVQISAHGAQSVTFSGSGIFEDDASGSALADAAANQTVLTGWKVVVPNWGEYLGDWIISDFGFDGGITGSLNFNVSFSQATPATFTANA